MDAIESIAGNVGLFLGYSLIAILVAVAVWALIGAPTNEKTGRTDGH